MLCEKESKSLMFNNYNNKAKVFVERVYVLKTFMNTYNY